MVDLYIISAYTLLEKKLMCPLKNDPKKSQIWADSMMNAESIYPSPLFL